MEQCRQCQRIFKKGQVHKVTPCTVPVSVRKDFRNAYNAFQGFFAKYPFDDLQQGVELPNLNELIKSHPNTLEKFPEILVLKLMWPSVCSFLQSEIQKENAPKPLLWMLFMSLPRLVLTAAKNDPSAQRRRFLL